jgi:hypothetical protein
MSGSRTPGSSCLFADNDPGSIDDGTLCLARSPIPGSVGLIANRATYSYSISGTPGRVGWMFSTETQRLPGTWYDRTEMVTKFRAKEAELGMSKYADKDFRKSAKRTLRNIKAPAKVDVDVHFENKGNVESVTVRGRSGTRSLRFDFDELEASFKKMPKGTDGMKMFMDLVAKIFAAVIQVR